MAGMNSGLVDWFDNPNIQQPTVIVAIDIIEHTRGP